MFPAPRERPLADARAQGPHRPPRAGLRVRPDGGSAVHPDARPQRALKAWAAAAVGAFLRGESVALEAIGLHELRHTYVSWMVDAGFTLERIGDYVGHSSAYMVDRYRHLLEGHEQEAADALGAYCARKTAGAESGADAADAAPLRGM